jgi:hypothetical protein
MTKKITLFVAAGSSILMSLAGHSAIAKESQPSNLGPDKWVTCAATMPGSSRHYYAFWNPGWQPPHNTQSYAISICNQWHGGVGPQVPPVAGSFVTSPQQYRPARKFVPGTKATVRPLVTPTQVPTNPGCGTPPSGIQNQNTC